MKRADARRFQKCKKELIDLIAPGEPFILVDEEQLRGDLPHTGAIPFPERDGQYWGPPGDDDTAIRELERLRKAGARYIAFIWATFWWLDHYRRFDAFLRKNCRCALKNDRLLVFNLQD